MKISRSAVSRSRGHKIDTQVGSSTAEGSRCLDFGELEYGSSPRIHLPIANSTNRQKKLFSKSEILLQTKWDV